MKYASYVWIVGIFINRLRLFTSTKAFSIVIPPVESELHFLTHGIFLFLQTSKNRESIVRQQLFKYKEYLVYNLDMK